MIDNILSATWTIFSQMNGNPELHQSATRFCMALFFLWMLYATIRMRVMSQYKPHQVVALSGCVIMALREFTLLITLSGWELGVFTHPLVHFLWPPIEHALELVAYSCFAWYTIEASQWSIIRRFARKIGLWFITFNIIFYSYTLYAWKIFFISTLPNIVYKYKNFAGDWQTHLILAFIAFVGLVAAFMKHKGSSYLFAFWIVIFLEHLIRTIVFGFYDEQAWQATIFHAMHIWSIPLLLLHFINAYVQKMGQCIECRRDVISYLFYEK